MENTQFEQEVKHVIEHAFRVLGARGFSFRPMRRTGPVRKNSSYLEGHTSIGSRTVTIDIYTARLRKPKKISAILAVLAHEIAHHQKKPYRQRHRGKWIVRSHYPGFYKQVTKNIEKMKKDDVLSVYYR